MKTQKLSPNGFTIVEVLVSIMVAGIVVGSLSQVVNNYVHLAQRGRFINLANSYVEAKSEALRNTGYSALSLGTVSLTSELSTQLPPSRSASMTITSPLTGIKEVNLTVSYQDQGRTNSYSYTTYVGELGVGQ